MPRNTRNFWVETRADGRETVDATGPRRKDGGFRTEVYVRQDGSPEKAVEISGYAFSDGRWLQLTITSWDRDGNPESRVIKFER